MREMGIATSGLGGTHLITQGYGYSAVIVVPVVEGKARPRVEYIPVKIKKELSDLYIIVRELIETPEILSPDVVIKYVTRKELARYSVVVAAKINREVERLEIPLPASLKLTLEVLSIADKSGAEITPENLTFVVKDGAVIYFDIEAIKKELRKYVKAKKLLELIDKLDEVDEFDKID